jgi:hypothetical protein
MECRCSLAKYNEEVASNPLAGWGLDHNETLDMKQCYFQLHMPGSCNGIAKQRHVVAQQWDSE